MSAKARWISTAGGDNEAAISVCKLPLVFQRKETAVVMFVTGRLERLVALTIIWSMVRRAGRSLARSSSFTVQLLSESVPREAASEFVIFEKDATPLVTDSSNKRIASVVLVVACGFGVATTTGPAV